MNAKQLKNTAAATVIGSIFLSSAAIAEENLLDKFKIYDFPAKGRFGLEYRDGGSYYRFHKNFEEPETVTGFGYSYDLKPNENLTISPGVDLFVPNEAPELTLPVFSFGLDYRF
jgi:hypothetical protein